MFERDTDNVMIDIHRSGEGAREAARTSWLHLWPKVPSVC